MSQIEKRVADYPHVREYFALINHDQQFSADEYAQDLIAMLNRLDAGEFETCNGYAEFRKLRKKAKKKGQRWLGERFGITRAPVTGAPRCPLCGMHLDYTIVTSDGATEALGYVDFRITARSLKHVGEVHRNKVTDVLA